MIQAKNLDNQNFDEITERAVSRIANYSDNWTNYNLSDPGITLIDLFAWYKEMEQYELNFYSEAIAERLLRLTGIERMSSRPAECFIHISPDIRQYYPKHSRLETNEGIIFETEEEIPEKRPVIKGIFIGNGEKRSDVSGIINEGVGIHPFAEGDLIIEFEDMEDDLVNITFDVAEHNIRKRNRPDSSEDVPRTIEWRWLGDDRECLVSDETNALSEDGRISFKVYGKTLVARLIDEGCEEEVIINGICTGDFKATQKRTVAKTGYFKVEREKSCRIELRDRPIREAGYTVFLRTGRGWTETEYDIEYSENLIAETIIIDSLKAAEDGMDNLRISYAEALLQEDFLFDSTGMPGQEIQLTLNGKNVLEDSFRLICDSRMEDGSISEEEWTAVPDFYSAGPRSRVFVYDRENEKIIFGDGKRGAVVPRGKGAILISSMEISECSAGNIPKNAGLKFIDSDTEVENTAANYGRDRENIPDMIMRCRNRINNTRKCVTAADYERAAMETPGLRVGFVRAVPGFDRSEPTRVSRYPVVTVVVIPDSDKELPVPDERFLNLVRKNLEDRRIIGTLVRVSGPKYIPLDIRVEVLTQGRISEELISDKVKSVLALGRHRKIGDSVFEGDIESAISEIDEVLSVTRIEISTSAAECYKDSYGYMEIPSDGVCWLHSLKIRS